MEYLTLPFGDPSSSDYDKLRNRKEWVDELDRLEILTLELQLKEKIVSVRELAILVDKSKSWVGVSLLLIKAFKLYPEMREFSNRNIAFKYWQKKNKMRRFLDNE